MSKICEAISIILAAGSALLWWLGASTTDTLTNLSNFPDPEKLSQTIKAAAQWQTTAALLAVLSVIFGLISFGTRK